MWNKCITLNVIAKQARRDPSTQAALQQHRNSLQARPHGSLNRWRRRTEVCSCGRTAKESAEEDKAEEAPSIQTYCPSASAVTGLSEPRGTITRRTAQWGAINVRPSPRVVVMADKRLSGSSHRHMCSSVFYQRGGTSTRTAEKQAAACTTTHLTAIHKWSCRHSQHSRPEHVGTVEKYWYTKFDWL